MNTGDMPQMASATYMSSTYDATDVFKGVTDTVTRRINAGALVGGPLPPFIREELNKPQPKEAPLSTRRVVQVFIVDTNENIPLDQCILYRGEQKLTDSNDQELFFEIDVKSLLEAHNKKRVQVIDKKVKDRTEYIEPARIRDLKMTVVNVAAF